MSNRKSFSSREVIKILSDDGWYEVHCVGDHHQYKHPTKKGRVTVVHPRKDIPFATWRSIFIQAQIDWHSL
jgi:predicted RNA binding protein YcfA (HicA-like mRNA interferase family)